MRWSVRALVACVAVSGCAHHRPWSEVHDVDGEDVELEVEGDLVRRRGKAVLTPRGLVFRTADGAEIPLAAVTAVSDMKRWRGALEGMGIGAGGGFVVGAAIGIADGDDSCEDAVRLVAECEADKMTRWEKAALGGIILGVLSGGAGLVVGTLTGSRDHYRFQTEQRRFVPTGPPGSVVGVTVKF